MWKSSLLMFLGLALVGLAACDKGTSTASSEGAENTGLKIAYVDGDSVLMKFEAFREASAALDARQRELEADLQKKGAALEKEIMTYQQQAQSGSLTGKEMQAREKYLGGRQEAILAERDRLAQEMLMETSEINDRLKKILEDKLAQLKKEEGYDFILSKVEGGPILLADEKYDITDRVIALLNASGETMPVDTASDPE